MTSAALSISFKPFFAVNINNPPFRKSVLLPFYDGNQLHIVPADDSYEIPPFR